MQREFTEVLIAVRICPAQSRCPASLSCLYGCRYSCHCHFYPEQAKLSYGDRNQNSDCLFGGGGRH